MIGVIQSWNGASLSGIGASLFASALKDGHSTPMFLEQDGFLMAFSKAAQHQSRSTFHVLFHGHIENRNELRRLLRPLNNSDSAIYAEAYSRWGDGVDEHVIGHYSAIICEPAKSAVRVCRSPIRAPALYVSRVQDQVIIATSPKAIFATGRVRKELDDQKIADSLILNYCEEERGWFKNVRRFKRAHFTWLTPKTNNETCFWRMEDIPSVRFKRDTEYVEAADALFREAVAASLEGFERPAVSLSGGLDSQAVAAYIMAARPERPLLSFTSLPSIEGSFDTPTRFGNERLHVEALGQMYPQLQMNWVTCVGLEPTHHLNDLFQEALCAPRNAPGLDSVHEIFKSAKAAGADVILTGSRGNLTFSYNGTGMLPDLIRRGQLWTLFRELRAGRIGSLKAAVRPYMPDSFAQAWRLIRGHGQPVSAVESSPINPAFAQEMNVMKRAKELSFDPYFVQKSSVTDYRRLLLNNAANEGGDVLYSIERLHGLPSRDPTAYRPFLEYCFAIPPEQYMRNGEERWLARRLLRGKIPEFVLNERRLGKSAADLEIRITQRKQELLDEIDWLMTDNDVSSRIDLSRLKRYLEIASDCESGAAARGPLSRKAAFAVARGIATARFIRFVANKNS